MSQAFALTQASVFVLRRNPFRDSSLLLDLFSEEDGRISAVVRYSKRQQARVKGMFEPFRLLACGWSGRGDVVTLKQTEEIRRYPLKQGALIQATYLNELLLKALLERQPHPELFQSYQRALLYLTHDLSGRPLLQFELVLLTLFGLDLPEMAVEQEGLDNLGTVVTFSIHPEQGLQRCVGATAARGVKISSDLLLALRNPETLEFADWQALRQVIDQLWQHLLPGKTLYARRLLAELS